MKVKPVVPRELANRDIEAILGHYLETAGVPAANGFIDALEQEYFLRRSNLSGLRFLSGVQAAQYHHAIWFRQEEQSIWKPL